MEEDLRKLTAELARAKFESNERETENRERTRRLLLALLDICDAFEQVFRAINAKKEACTPQMNIWVGNFHAVMRLLYQVLSEQGVVAIENVEQGFAPQWHRAVETVLDRSRPEGAIVEEVKRGYLWQGIVLRKAEVVVAVHREPEEDPNRK